MPCLVPTEKIWYNELKLFKKAKNTTYSHKEIYIYGKHIVFVYGRIYFFSNLNSILYMYISILVFLRYAGKIKLRRFDISRSTSFFLLCLMLTCYLVRTNLRTLRRSVQTMFPCHNVWSLNQLIWYIDMLFIATNDRSTRFWGKLGEGFSVRRASVSVDTF